MNSNELTFVIVGICVIVAFVSVCIWSLFAEDRDSHTNNNDEEDTADVSRTRTDDSLPPPP